MFLCPHNPEVAGPNPAPATRDYRQNCRCGTDRTVVVTVLSMDDAITAVPPACRRRLMVTCVIWGPLETVWCGGGEGAERAGVSVARRMISDRYVTARDGWGRGGVPGAACRAAGRRGDVDGAGRARAEIG